MTVDADISDWTVYASFKANGEVFTFENDRLQMTAEDDVSSTRTRTAGKAQSASHGETCPRSGGGFFSLQGGAFLVRPIQSQRFQMMADNCSDLGERISNDVI